MYKLPTKLMGLKSLTSEAPSFRIGAINVAFRLLSSNLDS